MQHLTSAELEAGLDYVREAPQDEGIVALIVRRPAVDEREVVAEATLKAGAGLVGDTWPERRSGTSSPDPDRQLTVMNNRVALLVVQVGRHQIAGGSFGQGGGEP